MGLANHNLLIFTGEQARAMLAELADKAASVFMKLDHNQLYQRIAALESELETIATKLAAGGPRSSLPSEEGESTAS